MAKMRKAAALTALAVLVVTSMAGAATSPGLCPCDSIMPCYSKAAYEFPFDFPVPGKHCQSRDVATGMCPAGTSYGCWGDQVPTAARDGFEAYAVKSGDAEIANLDDTNSCLCTPEYPCAVVAPGRMFHDTCTAKVKGACPPDSSLTGAHKSMQWFDTTKQKADGSLQRSCVVDRAAFVDRQHCVCKAVYTVAATIATGANAAAASSCSCSGATPCQHNNVGDGSCLARVGSDGVTPVDAAAADGRCVSGTTDCNLRRRRLATYTYGSAVDDEIATYGNGLFNTAYSSGAIGTQHTSSATSAGAHTSSSATAEVGAGDVAAGMEGVPAETAARFKKNEPKQAEPTQKTPPCVSLSPEAPSSIKFQRCAVVLAQVLRVDYSGGAAEIITSQPWANPVPLLRVPGTDGKQVGESFSFPAHLTQAERDAMVAALPYASAADKVETWYSGPAADPSSTLRTHSFRNPSYGSRPYEDTVFDADTLAALDPSVAEGGGAYFKLWCGAALADAAPSKGNAQVSFCSKIQPRERVLKACKFTCPVHRKLSNPFYIAPTPCPAGTRNCVRRRRLAGAVPDKLLELGDDSDGFMKAPGVDFLLRLEDKLFLGAGNGNRNAGTGNFMFDGGDSNLAVYADTKRTLGCRFDHQTMCAVFGVYDATSSGYYFYTVMNGAEKKLPSYEFERGTFWGMEDAPYLHNEGFVTTWCAAPGAPVTSADEHITFCDASDNNRHFVPAAPLCEADCSASTDVSELRRRLSGLTTVGNAKKDEAVTFGPFEKRDALPRMVMSSGGNWVAEGEDDALPYKSQDYENFGFGNSVTAVDASDVDIRMDDMTEQETMGRGTGQPYGLGAGAKRCSPTDARCDGNGVGAKSRFAEGIGANIGLGMGKNFNMGTKRIFGFGDTAHFTGRISFGFSKEGRGLELAEVTKVELGKEVKESTHGVAVLATASEPSQAKSRPNGWEYIPHWARATGSHLNAPPAENQCSRRRCGPTCAPCSPAARLIHRRALRRWPPSVQQPLMIA
jgi:hypothetical protein